MRYDARDGHTYLTAGEIRHQDGYRDVTPAMLRAWAASGALHRVTVGELAAALGRALPPGRDPDTAAMASGQSGPEAVYRWADVVRCETARRAWRRAHGGRPRIRSAA